ncbi:MAG: hypothetical protein WCL27_13130 [Betaproteobacteria bacterium]
MLRTKILFVAVLSMCACATLTEAQKEGMRLQSSVSQISKETQGCYDQIQAKTHYALIYQKVALRNQTPTIQQLSDSETVSDDLIPLALDWYAEVQECDRSATEKYARLHPEFGTLAAQWTKDVTRIMLNAITNRPTYGEVNRALADFKDSQKQDIRRTYARFSDRLKNQHNVELKQRAEDSVARTQAANAALQSVTEVFALAIAGLAIQQGAMAQAQLNYAASYPTYVPARTITQTRCILNSSTLSCTSY